MSENVTKARVPRPAGMSGGTLGLEPKLMTGVADKGSMRRFLAPSNSRPAGSVSGTISARGLLRLGVEDQEIVRRCWAAMSELDPERDREDVEYLESLIRSVARRQRGGTRMKVRVTRAKPR